jgi:hypothetical protein
MDIVRLRKVILVFAAVLAISGCSAEKPPEQKPAADAPEPTADEPAPKADEPGAAAEVPEGVTHLAGSPPAATEPCAGVPAGDGLLNNVARAIRRLACEPALFFEKAGELRGKLDLADGVELEFNGPRSVMLNLSGEHSGKDMAAALGVEKPVITTGRGGAWALRNWRLGSNPEDGELDLWKPALVTIGVTHDYSPEDEFGMVKPLTDAEQLRGWIIVAMPPEVLKVVDDEPAIELLKRGLAKFAADRELSSAPPEEAAAATGLDDERFRVARRSIGTGDDAVHSIDIWSARTQIGAEAILEALGLSGEIKHSGARDSDEYRLSSSHGKSEYEGLSITLRFERIKGARGGGNADFVLDAITVW